MVITQDIETFYKHNNTDLVKFCRYKRILDDNVLHDIVQDFYLRLAEYHCLDRYNPALGAFESYVIRILSNTIADYFNTTQPQLSVQYNETQTPTDPLEDIGSRINEWRHWIILHGGRRTQDLLGCLKARITGHKLDESKRSTYHRYLREFMAS